jgi:DNA-directed RNA polymerase subunit RPC12/RpoP
VNTEKIEIKPDDVLIACPYCLVSSIKLSAEEFALLKAGQQMVEVCQVCGKEVSLLECI